LCAGDSFAAPFVSGVAATYLELRPQASPATVRSALVSAATTVSTLSKPLLYSRLTLAPMTLN
jgi:subtilisin family serine protease